MADDEEPIDEDIAGDRNVNSGGIVELESRSVEDSLERVHRIDRQTDRKNGHNLHCEERYVNCLPAMFIALLYYS